MRVFDKIFRKRGNKIPKELKFTLGPIQLKNLEEALKYPDQKFVIKKYLKYLPNYRYRPGWCQLPSDDNPIIFDYPPVSSDILISFPEFGGGVYQVWAVSPRPRHIYSINIDYKNSQEPYRRREEEEVVEEEKPRKKKKSIVEEILSSEELDQETKKLLITAYYVKEYKLPIDKIGKPPEQGDILASAVKEVLEKDPKTREQYARRYLESQLGQDPIGEMQRLWSFVANMNPFLQNPFAMQNMMTQQWLMQFLNPQVISSLLNSLTSAEEKLIKVKKGNQIIIMPKSMYEKYKAKVETRKLALPTEVGHPFIAMFERYRNKEPGEVAALLYANETPVIKDLIRDICENDLTLDDLIERVRSFADEQSMQIIESYVSKNRKWLERIVEEVKNLYRIDKGEIEIDIEEDTEEEREEAEREEEIEPVEEITL